MQSNSLSTLDEIARYREKHLESRLIVDTNVLLLFLVGIYSPSYLRECPAIQESGKSYGVEHFELVEKIIRCFLYKAIITPHILSEVNMLSRTKVKPKLLHFCHYFSSLIKELEQWQEQTIGLKTLLKSGNTMEFGFTDISLVEIAKEKKWIILTDDFALYRSFVQKVPMIYFGSVVTREIVL